EELRTDKTDRNASKDLSEDRTDKNSSGMALPCTDRTDKTLSVLPSGGSGLLQLSDHAETNTAACAKGESLSTRLSSHAISVARDKKTGEVLLVFSQSDADAVRHVATIHTPFEIEKDLTEAQKRELRGDLDYYERLLKRKAPHER